MTGAAPSRLAGMVRWLDRNRGTSTARLLLFPSSALSHVGLVVALGKFQRLFDHNH